MFDRMVNFVIIISTFCPLLYNTIQVSQMELLHLRDLYCMFEITKGMDGSGSHQDCFSSSDLVEFISLTSFETKPNSCHVLN